LERVNFSHSSYDSEKEIVKQKLGVDASLPEDLQIAEISSGEVRNLIIKTLNDFYA